MSRPSPQTERVVALIEFMARRQGQAFTLAEISRRLAVHKQTCHSMLQTLVDSGWLVRHPIQKTYRLGPALTAVGRSAGAESPVLEYADDVMHGLVDELETTCSLLHLRGDRIVVLDAATPAGGLLFPLAVGQEYPLRAPVGTAFVAWASETMFERWTAGTTPEIAEQFRAAVTTTREWGYEVRVHTTVDHREELYRTLERVGAVETANEFLADLISNLIGRPDALLGIDKAEEYAVSALSAPVFDSVDAPPQFALSLTSPRRTPMKGSEVERVGKYLVAAATRLSQAVGVRERIQRETT